MLTQEVVEQDEFKRDFPADPVGYLNVIVRLILRECRLANLTDGFAKLAPLVKRYIEAVVFAGQASMADPRVMSRLNYGDAKSLLFNVFVSEIRRLSIEEKQTRPTGESIRVSATEPYPTTRQVIEAQKTVFNLVPCDSNLEKQFALWLDTEPPMSSRWPRTNRRSTSRFRTSAQAEDSATTAPTFSFVRLKRPM